MKTIATATWICVAIASLGLCGCSSGFGWWGKKKDDSIASRPPALPYGPDKPLASSGTSPGATTSGASAVNGTAATAGAPSAYPSTGYNMPASYAAPSATGAYRAPPSSGAAYSTPTNNVPANPPAYPTQNWPASSTAASSAIGTQNGPYSPTYPNTATTSPSPVAAGVPGSPPSNAWPASAGNASDAIRTADARAGQAAGAWSAPASSAAPAAPSTNFTAPWGSNGVPGDAASAEKAAGFYDPNNGASNVSPAGGDVRSFGSPRKEHYRPGSTKDYVPSSVAPPAASLPALPSARADGITPTNFSVTDANNGPISTAPAAVSSLSSPTPWNAPAFDNSTAPISGSVEMGSRYQSPVNVSLGTPDTNSNPSVGGRIDVSVGGTMNTIR